MVMIEIENIKKFMAGFLGGNLFDDFLMSEGIFLQSFLPNIILQSEKMK